MFLVVVVAGAGGGEGERSLCRQCSEKLASWNSRGGDRSHCWGGGGLGTAGGY